MAPAPEKPVRSAPVKAPGLPIPPTQIQSPPFRLEPPDPSLQPPASGLLLTAILLLAAALRLTDLDVNPPALFRDEAEKGYTAWSLARLGGYTTLDSSTGEPRFRRWPLFIETPGALTSATYQYAAAPIVGLLGPSEFAIRLPAALAGIVGVALSFLLARTLTGDARVALLAAFLLAVSPWQLIFSRWAAQGIFVPLLLSAGLWLFWRSAEPGASAERGQSADRSRVSASALVCWPLAALLFGAAAYTYDPARLVAPLLVIALAICAWREVRRHRASALLSAILLLAIIAPLFVVQLTTGAERLSRVSVFAPGTPLLKSLGLLVVNYLSHALLFVRGDSELRHSIPNLGGLLPYEPPFFVLGLVFLIRRRNPVDRFLLLWMLIAPLPAALTREAPHALRAIAMLPAPSIVSAIGFFGLWDWLPRFFSWWPLPLPKPAAITPTRVARDLRLLAFLATLLVAANVLHLRKALFVNYSDDPVVAAHWQYGLKQALWQIRQRESNGTGLPPGAASEGERTQFIFLSAHIPWAPILALVYERVDPARFRDEGLRALRPIYCLGPQDSPEDFYHRAPSGTWFVLDARDHMPGVPTEYVYYPARRHAPRRAALLLYRKP